MFNDIVRRILRQLRDWARMTLSPASGDARRRRAELDREADAARQARDWPRCVAVFAEMLELRPNDGPIWVQYGHSHKEAGDLRKAEQAYLRAGELMPPDADLNLQLGHLYKLMGQREKSIASYANAHELAPMAEDPIRELEAFGIAVETRAVAPAKRAQAGGGLSLNAAQRALADADRARFSGAWEKAAILYDRAVKLAPAEPDAWEHLGDALVQVGQRQYAERAYLEAIRQRPSAWGHLQLGRLYTSMGRWREAAENYEAAMRLEGLGQDEDERYGELVKLDSTIPEAVVAYLAGAREIFVVRGDIISTTGYAKAARALANELGVFFPVLGVSVHEDPNDNGEQFPAPLITQEAMFDLAARRKLTVVHHTTPENFTPVPGATNIADFYWETRATPRTLQWRERLQLADAIWAPTTFVREVCGSLGCADKVTLVPWPHRFDRGAQRRDRPGHDVQAKLYGPGGIAETCSFSDLRSNAESLIIAVQSLAPRKGLPMLLEGWRARLGEASDLNELLVLKLSFRHATNIGEPEREIAKLLSRHGLIGAANPRIAIIDELLSDDQMSGIIQAADALITCTYGEGFGGPVVEALSVGTPPIAPRHTGLRDLLPEDYPFLIEHAEHCIPLVGGVSVYPAASTWCVPEPGAVAAALTAFANADSAARREAASKAARHAEAFCGQGAVSSQLSVALGHLSRG